MEMKLCSDWFATHKRVRQCEKFHRISSKTNNTNVSRPQIRSLVKIASYAPPCWKSSRSSWKCRNAQEYCSTVYYPVPNKRTIPNKRTTPPSGKFFKNIPTQINVPPSKPRSFIRKRTASLKTYLPSNDIRFNKELRFLSSSSIRLWVRYYRWKEGQLHTCFNQLQLE